MPTGFDAISKKKDQQVIAGLTNSTSTYKLVDENSYKTFQSKKP